MIRRLELKNFTTFRDATFRFSTQLNVIHGPNGVGKSHVLKLAYVLQHALAVPPSTAGERPTKGELQRIFAEELLEVFRPDALGRLVTRTPPGRKQTQVSARLVKEDQQISFMFSSASKSAVKLSETPGLWLERPPVFLPTREALTLFPGFVSLYDTHTIEFDRTWRDLCLLLGVPVSRGARTAQARALLEPLEAVMGGRVELDRSGRFYLRDSKGRIEVHLVAEGLRKIAMVVWLIANGSLAEKGCLLWDEPDANLNPLIIKRVAKVLFTLAQQGVQVFIATHSLFLMRELSLLQVVNPQLNVQYFGVQRLTDGTVGVEQGADLADSGRIVTLDENLGQSERFLAAEF